MALTTSHNDPCVSRPGARCTGWGGCEKVCARVKRERDQARAKRSKEVRGFEMPHHPTSGKVGWCRWCGGEILFDKGKRAGERHTSRLWHPECVHVWKLHTDRYVQQAHLARRDGIGCVECGKVQGRYVRVWTMPTMERVLADSKTHGWLREAAGPLTVIMWTSGLAVDHRVPLWQVERLPEDERRRYFGPTNLQQLCDPCHASKTAREAAERAAARRAAKLDLRLAS